MPLAYSFYFHVLSFFSNLFGGVFQESSHFLHRDFPFENSVSLFVGQQSWGFPAGRHDGATGQ